MTDPREPSRPDIPDQETTRVTRADLGAFIGAVGVLVEEVKKGNALAVTGAAVAHDNAKRITKQVRGQLFAGVLFVALACGMFAYGCDMADRLGAVTAKLDETARLLDSLRSESDKTQKQVEGVKAQVQAVADEQPSVVLVDAGAGKPARPSIVVKPKAPPAPTPGPKAPPVAVPLDLPKATIPDSGLP